MPRAFLDFSVPSNLSFTVAGLEFAPFITALSLRRPLPDIGTPLAWTGEVTFSTPYPESQLPTSLNDLQNPSIWAMGVSPVVFKIGNETIARLRIMEYTYDDEDEVKTGTARLGDLLTIHDSDGPAQAWQELIEKGGFESFGTKWSGVISQALSSAGVPNNLGIDFSIPVAKDKPQGSVIKWAQQILGERGYWLYVDSGSEIVRAIKYPQNIQSGDVLFTRPRSGVERFRRRSSGIIPKEKIVASGSTEVETVNPEKPDGAVTTYDYDESGNVTTSTTVETLTSTQNLLVTRTTVQSAITTIDKYISRFAPGNYSLTATRVETTTQKTNSKGQVTTKSTDVQSPLGVTLPSLVKDAVSNSSVASPFPYYTNLLAAGGVTETWTANEYGLVIRYERVASKPYRYSAGGLENYAGFIYEKELEEYTGVSVLGPGQPPSNSYTKTYRRWIRKSDSFKRTVNGVSQWIVPAIILRQCTISADQQPPALQSLRNDRESNTIPLKGEANFQVGNTTPFAPKREDIQFQTLTTDAEAQALASRYGEMLFQSAYGRQFNMGLNDATEWYVSPRPFQIAVIHDGMFVLTGDAISWGDDGIEISWDANWLGAVPAVPED